MGISRKDQKRSIEELRELIKNTDDENLKKEYLFYLYQTNILNKNRNKEHLKSYNKRLRELERIYQDNKDLYQVIIDYNNSLSNELATIEFIDENLEVLEKSFPILKFNKKQSIALTRNFYNNLDPSFLEILDQIIDKRTLTIKKKLPRGTIGMNYFVGGINKNIIDIKKHGNFTDYFTLVHETGHAINNIYNPKGYYELNFFDELVSFFTELVAIYEGRLIFNSNLILYENTSNFLLNHDLVNTFYDQKQIVDLMYINECNKFNKQFIKQVSKELDYKKDTIKDIVNTNFYDEGDYPLSYIMALELLYIYKHNKKEAVELLKELMHKLPLNNQISEISKYLEPNVHAYDETKEIIDSASYVIKKTLNK